ncbi:MAG: glycosyltransferase family 39 protein [Campylobacteraceae bacterium]|nr:glycosyltransferase family 39 protein [Campylobacteraceae bacterium]
MNLSSFYKIFIGISTLAYAYFIFSFPASYYNDDSLFLRNGIINFSVIDFSPHFPGYASLILFGKSLNFFLQDAKESLFILTATYAILLPLVVFLYIKKIHNENIAFISYLLTLSSPYLVNLSLSMLSDSMGLFFLFLSLYLMEDKKYKLSGLMVSIALFARPSYLILFLITFIYLMFLKKESLKKIFISFFITSVFFLLSFSFVIV